MLSPSEKALVEGETGLRHSVAGTKLPELPTIPSLKLDLRSLTWRRGVIAVDS